MTLNDATALAAVAMLATVFANLLLRRTGEPLYPHGWRSTKGEVATIVAMTGFAVPYLLGVFPAGWFGLGFAIFACVVNVNAIAHRRVARHAVDQRPA